MGPGKSVTKEFNSDFYRSEFGEPNQPARAEANIVVGLTEQVVRSELVKFTPKEFKPDLEYVNAEFETRLEELRNSATTARD